MVFNVVYLNSCAGDWEVHNTIYSTIKKVHLEQAMEEIGFSSTGFYGDYELNNLDLEEGGRYVVVGEK